MKRWKVSARVALTKSKHANFVMFFKLEERFDAVGQFLLPVVHVSLSKVLNVKEMFALPST